REASMIHPIIMNGPASHTCVMDLSVSEPSIQNRISVAAKGLGDRLSTNVDAAPAKADTATPARMRVSVLPLASVKERMRRTATKAPARPARGSANGKNAERPV